MGNAWRRSRHTTTIEWIFGPIPAPPAPALLMTQLGRRAVVIEDMRTWVCPERPSKAKTNASKTPARPGRKAGRPGTKSAGQRIGISAIAKDKSLH